MTTWIDVTQEQVDAARLHVEAYRSAGLEPDPIIAALAEAVEQPEETGHDTTADRDRTARQTARQVARELAEQLQVSSGVFAAIAQAYTSRPGTANDLNDAIGHVHRIYTSTSDLIEALDKAHGEMVTAYAGREVIAFKQNYESAVAKLQSGRSRQRAKDGQAEMDAQIAGVPIQVKTLDRALDWGTLQAEPKGHFAVLIYRHASALLGRLADEGNPLQADEAEKLAGELQADVQEFARTIAEPRGLD